MTLITISAWNGAAVSTMQSSEARITKRARKRTLEGFIRSLKKSFVAFWPKQCRIDAGPAR
jgi:hypothetical protein